MLMRKFVGKSLASKIPKDIVRFAKHEKSGLKVRR